MGILIKVVCECNFKSGRGLKWTTEKTGELMRTYRNNTKNTSIS